MLSRALVERALAEDFDILNEKVFSSKLRGIFDFIGIINGRSF